jgi:hypothetical protein
MPSAALQTVHLVLDNVSCRSDNCSGVVLVSYPLIQGEGSIHHNHFKPLLLPTQFGEMPSKEKMKRILKAIFITITSVKLN